MPVEREEFVSLARLMPQYHERAVVQRSGIVSEDVNDAIQRRIQGNAGLAKKIDSHVYSSPPIRGVSAPPKQERRVKQPRFIVAPHTHLSACAFHCAKY